MVGERQIGVVPALNSGIDTSANSNKIALVSRSRPAADRCRSIQTKDTKATLCRFVPFVSFVPFVDTPEARYAKSTTGNGCPRIAEGSAPQACMRHHARSGSLRPPAPSGTPGSDILQ